MKITTIDIQKQQFRLRFRGFDVREVDSFLTAVAEEFKDLVSENDTLKSEIARLEEQLVDYRGREKTLQEALVSAQRMADTVRGDAQRQAELTIAEAKLQAERILSEAQQRLTRLHDDMSELKRQYVQFETRVRSAVEAHLKLLDLERDEPAVAKDAPLKQGMI
jgi:cell division initiation protein